MTMTEHEHDEAPPSAALEIVETPAPVDQRRNDLIDEAAHAAITTPGVPDRQEFMTLAMTAKMLCMSGAAPKAVQNNPYVAFHVAMVGRDFDISPSAALNLIDVIEAGGKTTLSLSPQLLNGQIRRLGLGSIVPAVRTEETCIAVALTPSGFVTPHCTPTWPIHHETKCECRGILGESEFTWEDARMAGLVGEGCEPGAHVTKTLKRRDNSTYQACGCNQGYITYPKRMLWWRASGFAADDFFPEASLGMYSPEALGAVVDEEGRAIDPAQVALPQGYDDPKEAAERKRAEADPPAPEDEQKVLALRVDLLPDEEKAELRAKWKQNGKLSGHKPDALSTTQHRLAVSMVKGMENKAKARCGYNATAAVEEALGASGADSGTEGTTEPVEAQDGVNAAETEQPEATPETAEPEITPAAAQELEAAAGEEVVDKEIERVKSMKPALVKDELQARGKSIEGNVDQLRQRLTIALLKERIAAKQASDA